MTCKNYDDRLTLKAGLASGWKTDRALIALTRTPIGWASCGIACMISWKTWSKGMLSFYKELNQPLNMDCKSKIALCMSQSNHTNSPCGTAECCATANSHSPNWPSVGRFPYTDIRMKNANKSWAWEILKWTSQQWLNLHREIQLTQKISNFQKGTLLCKLLNGIPPVPKNPFITINVANRRSNRSCVKVTRVIKLQPLVILSYGYLWRDQKSIYFLAIASKGLYLIKQQLQLSYCFQNWPQTKEAKSICIETPQKISHLYLINNWQ